MKASRLFRFSTLLLLLFSLSAVTAQESRNELRVYVLQQGQPLAGVTVVLDDSVEADTDPDGLAVLPLRAGNHSLLLRRGGVILADGQFSSRAGESAEATVALRGREQEPVVSINLLSGGEAAPGTLTGYVTSAVTGAPLTDATVRISGLGAPLKTDITGIFSTELPSGTYQVRIAHPDAGTRTFESVRVIADTITEFDFVIGTPEAGNAGGPVEEVVATARYVPNTLEVAERNSESVLEAISEQEISIAGDSTAAAALQRVTGLTLVDNKYVYVRGLGERYSSTLLNGAELPSPEPTRRVVPLDLFPTEVLEGILIQKTYSPDLPGDFSGGAVRLQTTGVPAGHGGKISLSLGGNSQSTFGGGSTYAGGDTDYLGFDDGTCDIPDLAAELTDGGRINLGALTPEQREAVAESLPVNYAVEKKTLPPDVGLEFSIGDRLDRESGSYGYQFAFIYDNEWRFREEDRASIALDTDGLTYANAVSELERTEQTINLGGMLSLVAEIGDNHTLKSNTLLTRKTSNSVYQEQGVYSGESREFVDTTLEWIETQLFSQQLTGKHYFGEASDIVFDWQATVSGADRDVPDQRQYSYARLFTPGEADRGPYQLAATTALGRRPLTRSWEYLQDDTTDLGASLTIPATLSESITADLELGIADTARERESTITRWRFDLPSPIPPELSGDLDLPVEQILTAGNIGPGDWQLLNASLVSDSYTASQDISAYYLMATMWFGSDWQAQFGARQESSEIEIATFQLTNPEQLDITRLENDDTLPALTLTWYPSDSAQVRFGASKTVNRPQFRELSPVPFTDPETRYTVEGNPELEQAEITNLDVRYEYYWTDSQLISIAGFYKDFANPIEQVIVGGGSDGRGVRTYQNAGAATNYGLELEFRNELAEWSGVWSGFEHMYFSSNLALIESEVSISPEQAAVLTNIERPLQGQSPWVVNLQLSYDNLATLTQAALLFNMFGERIVDVGQKGLPDAYEQPVPTLDFSFSKGFTNGWTLKFKARNLLDPEVEVTRGGTTERSYTRGVDVSFTAEYAF